MVTVGNLPYEKADCPTDEIVTVKLTMLYLPTSHGSLRYISRKTSLYSPLRKSLLYALAPCCLASFLLSYKQ